MEFQTFDETLADAINKGCAIVHDWAQKKGWWEQPRNKGELIALMHSELSECLEALRAKEQPHMDDKVPELTGEAAELADTVIRIFDYCGGNGIDLGQAIAMKHAFNTKRPYKHGKTF
jgi:NTP pyrophosphatase (non-canonical NTP hydrolase)